MRLLITGTGRCGTLWLTKALVSLGIPCKHEIAYSLTQHGEGSWEAECSWLAAPYLNALANDTYVVHLVRNPLATIRSRLAWGTFRDSARVPARRRLRGDFAIRHCPQIATGETELARNAIHWAEWNQLILDNRPELGEELRLEDITDETILRLARIVQPNINSKSLPSRNNEHQQSPQVLGPPLTLSQLPNQARVLELADRWNYQLS